MRTEVFIGVDISKPRLDVFNLATGEVLEFANSPSGIQAFVKYAKKTQPTLLVCESTGGLEQPLLLGCSEAKLPLAVVNPRQVRDFSRRTGPEGLCRRSRSSFYLRRFSDGLGQAAPDPYVTITTKISRRGGALPRPNR